MRWEDELVLAGPLRFPGASAGKLLLADETGRGVWRTPAELGLAGGGVSAVPASQVALGTVKVATPPQDPQGPVVVETGDPRMANARAPTAHSHPQSDVTGLSAALGGKVDTTDARLSNARPPTAHTHPITEVTNLQTALDGKADDGDVAAEASARASGDALLIPLAQKGAVSGVATLDSGGKVPAAQLPASSGGADVKQTEVDFGTTPRHESAFTIADPAVTAGSQIVGTVAYEAPTGRDRDEVEMDPMVLSFGPGAGQFTVFVRALEGRVYGRYKINYMVA